MKSLECTNPHCSSCKDCCECDDDFNKVMDFKKTGLVIYRHTIKRNDNNKDEDAAKVTGEHNVDVFILQNTKDIRITSTDCISEIDKNDISCPRCRNIIERAQKLLFSVPTINKYDVLGICNHCLNKEKSCFYCKSAIRKFISTKQKPSNETKQQIQLWLPKMKLILEDLQEARFKGLRRERSDVNIDDLLLSNARLHREKYMSYRNRAKRPKSQTHLSDEQIEMKFNLQKPQELHKKGSSTTNLKERRLQIIENIHPVPDGSKKELVFRDKYDITSYDHNRPHETANEGVQQLESLQEIFSKHRSKSAVDRCQFNVKTFDENIQGLNGRIYTPRKKEGDIHTPKIKIPIDITRINKPGYEQRGIIVKNQSLATKAAPSKNELLDRKTNIKFIKTADFNTSMHSYEQRQAYDDLQSLTDPSYSTRFQKRDNRTQKLEVPASKLKLHKDDMYVGIQLTNPQKNLDTMRKHRSLDSLFTSSLSTKSENKFSFNEGFDYFFPKKSSEFQQTKQRSSSELIKETQDMLLARAAEEKKKLEAARLRKKDLDEKVRIAREEKRKLLEEKKKIEGEMQLLVKDDEIHVKTDEINGLDGKEKQMPMFEIETEKERNLAKIEPKEGKKLSKKASVVHVKSSKISEKMKPTYDKEKKETIKEQQKTKKSMSTSDLMKVTKLQKGSTNSQKDIGKGTKTKSLASKESKEKIEKKLNNLTPTKKEKAQNKIQEIDTKREDKSTQRGPALKELHKSVGTSTREDDKEKPQSSKETSKENKTKQPKPETIGKTSIKEHDKLTQSSKTIEQKPRSGHENKESAKEDKAIQIEITLKGSKERLKDLLILKEDKETQKGISKRERAEEIVDSKWIGKDKFDEIDEIDEKESKIKIPKPEDQKIIQARKISIAPTKYNVTKVKKDTEGSKKDLVKMEKIKIFEPKPENDGGKVKEKEKILNTAAVKESKNLKEQENIFLKATEAASKISKVDIKTNIIVDDRKGKQGNVAFDDNIIKEMQVSMNHIKMRKPSTDDADLILKLVKLKQSERRVKSTTNIFDVLKNETKELIFERMAHLRRKSVVAVRSDFELDIEDMKYKKVVLSDLIVGQNIVKKDQIVEEEDVLKRPVLFKSNFFIEEPKIPLQEQVKNEDIEEIIIEKSKTKAEKTIETEPPKGTIRYALSDRSFIEKGWTMLPTEKIVRKMNVYRMRPAHPEFDWFEHNKNKQLMLYDSGETLAQFDEDGRGRWYYKNGRIALDYYDCEELNANQRFVIYSSGEPDDRGRSRLYTVLAMFDYLGNGVVFDHTGKIRLKYNQTEGIVLDRNIGPVSHWKWHTLNDPPVLQQVMIDTQLPHKDPRILQLGDRREKVHRPDNDDMLAIEFDNFIKEKRKKQTQTFKPFQIRMKALKINEQFSLKVLDQANIYLIYREGTTNLKLNIGMILDQKEIVDTDTAELGEVSNTLERFPACTDSVAALQKDIAHAQFCEKIRNDHERRLRNPPPCSSVDKLNVAASRPLQPPLRTVASCSKTSTTDNKYCKRKPPSCDVYYDTRLF